MSIIFGSILGGIGALILASLLASLKWLFTVKQTVEKVHLNDVRRARQMGALFKILLCNTKAVRATLEVAADIKNNGNVKEALDHLDAGDKILEAFNAETAWA